jgi:hypothetical protein
MITYIITQFLTKSFVKETCFALDLLYSKAHMAIKLANLDVYCFAGSSDEID